MTEIECDMVVVGAGMAGVTAAARAAELGASVILLEIGSDIGGSAALSEGYVWTAPTIDSFQAQDPAGNIDLFRPIMEGLDESLLWVERMGVAMGPRLTQVMGFGEGRQIDVHHYMRAGKGLVEARGGWVFVETDTTRLRVDDRGAVVGVEVVRVGTGETARIDSSACVLATGGFQGSATLREELMFRGAGGIVLRANRLSDGRGFRLGREVGAGTAGPMANFYGHLVPAPLQSYEPSSFAMLTQYHSAYGVLVGEDGKRFTDESLGSHFSAQSVARLGHAVLVIDERVRRDYVLPAFIPGMDTIDKMAEAGRRGARYSRSDTIMGLAKDIGSWGYDGRECAASIAQFNSGLSGNRVLDPPRRFNRVPLKEAPFFALEVQAAITSTYGGLASDSAGRVLDANSTAIPGLFVAGVDAGGLNVKGYTGGLARGLVMGRIVAETAMSN